MFPYLALQKTGSLHIEICRLHADSAVKQPRLALAALCFKRFNVVCVLQGQADFVQTVEQAVFAVFGDVEREGFAARCGNGLFFQVNA